MKRSTIALALCLFLPGARQLAAQTPATDAANITARKLNAARQTPGLLLAMLREMPKGGDLHIHLSGAVYAESFIEWAAAGGRCIQVSDYRSAPPPCDSTSGKVPATAALQNDELRGHVIDAWSMRNWSRTQESGHDHFFATFGKFSQAGSGHGADMLVEELRRAASDGLIYVEIMDTPNDGAGALGSKVGWDENLANMREKLNNAGLPAVVAAARAHYANLIAQQRQTMQCDAGDAAEPGCAVTVRFLYQVLRGNPPERVFAQILTAFEAASADSNVVGFNMVQPEDGYLSMRDFSLQMRMIDYLHGFFPDVKISLHAGELAPGLVPPEGLRFHIRESVERGHASRIGHGVDVMHENGALQLLSEMAKRGVAVEICLTSNDVILNVSGREHPLSMYQRYGVPTALATDDEGVSRSDMTLEYKRAVQDQGLDYPTLKQMARNSIKYAFVQDSLKAQLLATLDKKFAAFEAKWSKP